MVDLAHEIWMPRRQNRCRSQELARASELNNELSVFLMGTKFMALIGAFPQRPPRRSVNDRLASRKRRGAPVSGRRPPECGLRPFHLPLLRPPWLAGASGLVRSRGSYTRARLGPCCGRAQHRPARREWLAYLRQTAPRTSRTEG